MIILYNQKWMHRVFKDYFYGFACWPIIFFKYRRYSISQRMLKHEKEHLRQQVRGLLMGFFIRYYWELFYNKLVKKMSWEDAYMNISYEIKARKAELR